MIQLTVDRAKYIEGLENRLGRMEALLKMSGLLNREEAGGTDLGTLEQRLAQKESSSPSATSGHTRKPSSSYDTVRGSPPHHDHSQSPTSAVTSPNGGKREPQRSESEQDVEALSELMCSLVTNNQGDTIYIGDSDYSSFSKPSECSKVLRPDSPSSLHAAFNGSAKRQAIALSAK